MLVTTEFSISGIHNVFIDIKRVAPPANYRHLAAIFPIFFSIQIISKISVEEAQCRALASFGLALHSDRLKVREQL